MCCMEYNYRCPPGLVPFGMYTNGRKLLQHVDYDVLTQHVHVFLHIGSASYRPYHLNIAEGEVGPAAGTEQDRRYFVHELQMREELPKLRQKSHRLKVA